MARSERTTPDGSLRGDKLQASRGEESAARNAPDPDDARKPDTPTDIDRTSWKYVLKKTFREFNDDQCTDSAAALTYYGVLAIFPALIAMLSLIGLFGDPKVTVQKLSDIVRSVGPSSAVDALHKPLMDLATSSSKAGLALVFGLITALWSASGYVSAFSRMSNRIYEVQEGRPFWKLRPLQLAVTAVAVVLITFIVLSIVLSGSLAQSVGSLIGLGGQTVTVWNWAKWPVMAVIVSGLIALLYYAAPNVKQPKFAWFSVGSVVALVTWLVASAIFGLYVSKFGSYDKTYGTLAGVIVFLLWLWITNNALLFGAELNAELERGRELQAGMPAEEQIQLPPRDTTKIDKKEAKEAKDIAEAREIRRDT